MPPATVTHECRSSSGVVRPDHEFDRDGVCFFCPVTARGERRADELAAWRLNDHIDMKGREARRRHYENYQRREYGE